MKSIVLGLILLAVAVFGTNLSTASAQTPQEKRAVRKITTKIDRAGKEFKAKDMEAAARLIGEAQTLIGKLPSAPSSELIELLTYDYQRLQKAHELLTEAGHQLPPLPALPQPMAVDGVGVSFKSKVAPILVAKCGNCHVQRNRGDFSAASYAALNQSPMLVFGNPNDSRMIEVIVDGEMPKGGLKVSDEELQTLKNWIAQGAKFDGQNPGQSLNELIGATNAPAAEASPKLTATKPTGKETVSFGLHIAPILTTNCNRCHIADDRGDLSMDTFAQLLRGGDSGSPLVPGKSAASLIYKRVAAGEMPPDNKLPSESIALIKKWIDEGAAFDGATPTLSIFRVSAVAKAKSQTHEELAVDRKNLAVQNWKLAMGRVVGTHLSSENFVVAGAADEKRLESVAQLLEELVPKVVSQLKTGADGPLVKGKASVFVFDKRYDFSEFGKMIEKREMPREASGHWNYTVSDAYAAVLLTRNQSADDAQVELAHQIAALHVASLAPDVPRWFADGLGLWTAKKIYSRDESFDTLDTDAERAAQTMSKPDDFIKGRLTPEQASLVSYLFVKNLKQKSSSFNSLMKGLQAGQTFESAFQSAFGITPANLMASPKKRR